MRSSIIFATGLAFWALSSTVRAQAPNSPKDPYGPTPDQRVTASAPVPYGFIIGGRYTAFLAKAYAGPLPTTAFSVDAFYDAWQLGFHSLEYGNMFRITSRSVGRDLWNGWFVEAGNGDNPVDSITKASMSFIGVGLKYGLMLQGSGFTTGYTVEGSIGSASWDDDPSTAKAWTGSSGLYAAGTISILWRIPISTVGLQVGAQYFIEAIPNVKSSGDLQSYSGLAFNVAVGLNFQN